MMGKWSDEASDVVQNLREIQHNISEACIASGRRPEEVTLLGVTKTVPPARINSAISAGLLHIGENRVQEFLSKKEEINLENVKVHLIGHLQTNKISRIITNVDMIESVDSLRLADAINKQSIKINHVTNVLVEVNIGREQAKSGVMEEKLDELLYEISGMKGLNVLGLMTVPPIFDTEHEKRAVFSHMYKLFIDIRGKNIDNIHMDILSMGMSSDYIEAIKEGATIIRVGSAIFGKRG
ncbi:MAG: YggS family pyridoxal phosphate-dependent enzyme [Oscillospiraceae bacterium]|nr:YggS family pyridoxal phosphate-dependent enzyme [Oscillospiraceae bacterium]MDD3832660.1 YggS family pyridoxal phosphate-dependent enzyme [Oscillospiraceae bacterium]MDD4546679.1 YggS family pyridoxal phosphate-dependent enzyme [Oscillospiraceae bacterium]